MRALRARRCTVVADRVHVICGRGRVRVMSSRGTVARNLAMWD